MATNNGGEVSTGENTLLPAVTSGGGATALPPPKAPQVGEDDEDDGMLRMSFIEHLEEMRSRLLKAVYGTALAYLTCLIFAPTLWDFVRAPAVAALTQLGINPPELVITQPMESFSILYVKLPLLAAVFLAAPWIVFQVWSFIAPGLYDKEKRMAAPFILVTAGLFISGGLFAYFIAFRYGLTFLLGIGMGGGIRPMVTITSYFDLFMNVMLGVALTFELPVIIFFLTLLRIASPRFLMRHSRYAVLIIVIIAAVLTPTPDFFNLTLFALPMCLLYFVGVFASYLLVLSREGRHFPWGKTILVIGGALLALGGIAYFVLLRMGYHAVTHWPFMVK